MVLIDFYAGFQNCDMFWTVFRDVEPTATNMIRWSQGQRTSNIVCTPFRAESLSLVYQFFFFVESDTGFFTKNFAQRFCVT